MKVLLLIVSVLLILVSLLQTSKSGGISAFTGKQDVVFSKDKTKGNEKKIWWITFSLAVAYFLIVLITKLL